MKISELLHQSRLSLLALPLGLPMLLFAYLKRLGASLLPARSCFQLQSSTGLASGSDSFSRIIINNNSDLSIDQIIPEIVRIMHKGLVTISDKGPSYQARTIFEGCVFECKRNKCSFVFNVRRLL